MIALRTACASFALATVVCISQAACSSSDEPTRDEQSPELVDGPTFAQTIEPLVQEKCQSCHREGGVAPFSLVGYEEVKAMGESAKGKVQRREMPPWGAQGDEACTPKHAFKDDMSLSQAQIDSFVRWVEIGMPLGDASKRPPLRTTFPTNDLADKTATFEPAKPYSVSPGKDDIRCFPIDPGFAADTWIGGSNVVPGDSRIVHHVIVYVDEKGQAATRVDETGSYPCFGGPDIDSPSLLLAWAPGTPPTSYGEGAGLKVSKGSKLVMQVHYHPSQDAVVDRTRIELKALAERPAHVAQVILAGNATSKDGPISLLPGPADPPSGPEFLVPANVKGHTESMELVVPDQIGGFPLPTLGIYAVGTHMHWAGVDMKIEIERKVASNGQPSEECLLGTPKYEFNWQRSYAYDEPLDRLPTVSGGDKIRFTCTYDNTTGNRHVVQAMSEMRMSSPPEIRLGETTLDEMCLGLLVVVRPATPLD